MSATGETSLQEASFNHVSSCSECFDIRGKTIRVCSEPLQFSNSPLGERGRERGIKEEKEEGGKYRGTARKIIKLGIIKFYITGSKRKSMI